MPSRRGGAAGAAPAHFALSACSRSTVSQVRGRLTKAGFRGWAVVAGMSVSPEAMRDITDKSLKRSNEKSLFNEKCCYPPLDPHGGTDGKWPALGSVSV